MTAEANNVALIERYKRNNVDLAISLNEKRNELRAANELLIEKCREIQEKKDEIVDLKQQLAERDAQLNLWRTTMIEVFQANTRQYARLMGMIGCNTGASSNAVAATTTQATRPPPLPAATNNNINNDKVEEEKKNDSNSSIRENFVDKRARRGNNNDQMPLDINNRLSNLTEESTQNSKDSLHDISSFSDVPVSNSSTPRKSSNLSRSLTESPSSPPKTKIRKPEPQKKNKAKKKPLKEKNQNVLAEKENIFDDMENGKDQDNRPRRKAAPSKLKEPKINVKLRRN